MNTFSRYILATALLSLPLFAFAQDDNEDYDVLDVAVRKLAAPQKNYETRTVKGMVIEAATGNPISGAMVKAMGIEGYSTLTGDDGKYEMKVPVFSSSLFVSYPDCNSASVGLASGENQKTVSLLSTDFRSDYSTETNILANYSADNFKYSNAINIKDEMQNQLGAYAHTVGRSGTPGIGSVTFIQGLNSLNVSAQPLVVVDGVVLDQQYGNEMLHSGFYNDILSSINPAEIENVTVMRNGTALYGARGANGVINITTHRSKSMATRITASISAGVTFEPKYYSMMNAEQYRSYASELLKGTGTELTTFQFLKTDPTYYYYNQYHNNTDWKDMIYRNAFTQNYGISVEGGDDVAQYNLSVGYVSNNSTLEKNDYDRLNIRFNTDIQLIEKLAVRFDISFSNQTRSLRDDGAPSQYEEGTPTAPSFLAYVKSPFLSPYSYGNGKLSDTHLDITDEAYLDEALSSFKNYNYKLGNPVALNEYADGENKNRFENSMFNLAVTPKYNFGHNLILSEHFSYTLVNSNEKYYISVNGIPSYYVASVSANRDNQVSSLASKQNSIQSDTRLSWNNRFDAHNLYLFGGARLNIENFTRGVQLGYNTGSDKTPFMSSSLLNANAKGSDYSWKTLDWYVQGNYSYLDRYFAQVNLTASGSSRFGTDAEGGIKAFGVVWGFFPSIQGSWVVTNEPWFPKTKGIDYIKLTAGYDVSGNDNIDVFASKSYFASNLYLNAVSALSFTGIGNKEIKWETTRRFNAGLEMNLLDNRLTVGFDYFNSRTSDLLALQSLGFLSGIESNWANIGKLSNEGFDASVRGKLVASRNWSWELGATMGHYQNKVLDLGEGTDNIIASYYGANIITQVGSSANMFYGYKTNGVFATTEQANAAALYVRDANGVDKHYFGAGDVVFEDNGDGEINEKDMYVIGNPNPDIYGNIFTSLQWKRLRLDVNFNYSLGNDVYNYMRSQLEGGSRFMNQTTNITQRWMSEGQLTSVPRISFQDEMGNSRFSDRWIEDGSYLKLKSVTLSYTLPVSSTFLQGLEFWVQGNNLLTLTRYLGSDPEFSSTSSVIGQGVDTGCLGSSRSVVAGVKIKL